MCKYVHLDSYFLLGYYGQGSTSVAESSFIQPFGDYIALDLFIALFSVNVKELCVYECLLHLHSSVVNR